MPTALHGAIDCDVHIPPPPTAALLPYLDAYWREQFTIRGLVGADFALTTSASRTPLACRPDWRPGKGESGLALLQRHVLDHFGTGIAIGHCLHGAVALHTEDMAAALCRAVNDWVAAEWLSRDDRLRASILVPTQNVALAVAEIERCAADRRFVQVLVLAMLDHPLGRRQWWPLHEAAARHGLPLGIHAGGLNRHATTPTGWPSTHLEDHVVGAQAFDAQLASLLTEGVFTKFPDLRVVLLESGFTWLPTFLWRMNKIWRGLRAEVPWVTRLPADILRQHVRITLQPVDAPPRPEMLAATLAQIDCDDMLLFSTDYPHWQFDADAALPEGLPEALLPKLLRGNALATFPRLAETAP